MTDILEDMKRVRDYLLNVDNSVPLQLTSKISRLEELATLGDLSPIRKAWEAGQKASTWYGEDTFEEIPPGLAKFFKAFYDAASQLITPDGLRLWTTTDQIPDDVNQIADVDGDVWFRTDWQRWDSNDLYAPYTESRRY